MTIVEMCVHMDCAGCESKIRKALQKLEGVDDIDIDMASQKVTVMGYVEQKKVLKAVRKTGRRAVLWPYPYNPESHAHNQHYYPQHHPALNVMAHSHSHSSAPSSSYNYYKHGYDDSSMHVYHHTSAYSSSVVGEKAGNMFSDDNTSACSIM